MTKIHHNLEMSTCVPLKFKMDNSILILIKRSTWKLLIHVYARFLIIGFKPDIPTNQLYMHLHKLFLN